VSAVGLVAGSAVGWLVIWVVVAGWLLCGGDGGGGVCVCNHTTLSVCGGVGLDDQKKSEVVYLPHCLVFLFAWVVACLADSFVAWRLDGWLALFCLMAARLIREGDRRLRKRLRTIAGWRHCPSAVASFP
jgi:hypothetical protein